MKTALIIFLVLMPMVGCALIDSMAPPQVDEQGQPIPGSREPTATTQAVADVIPYGNVALSLLLFAVAGYEKFRAYKLEKGLKATLLAGKQVAADPKMAELWDKVKDSYYRNAHEAAGVTSLIKSLLSKLGSVK